MKEVFSLAMFALGVLCFAAFVTMVKPTAISAIQVAPDYRRTDPSGMPGCDLHAFAAVSGAGGGLWILGAAEFYGRDTTTARSRGTCRTNRE